MTIVRPATTPEYYFAERCFISELLNTPASPALSVARARVEPGVTTVLHALRGTEVYYLLSGSGTVHIGGEQASVGPGDLVHIPPGTPQQITNTGAEDLIFLAICSPRFRERDYRVVGTGGTE